MLTLELGTSASVCKRTTIELLKRFHVLEIHTDDALYFSTKWAQNYIYQHQHPESCEGKKFYVLKNHWPNWGLGALIRAVMREISLAIMDDRILVFDPNYGPGSSLVDVNCTHKSLLCVVDDITNCGAYVTTENSVTVRTALMQNAIETEQEVPPAAMVLMIENMAAMGLQPTGAFARYWWRSQMYGYIMRPNREALARMLEMRMNSTIQMGTVLRRGEASEVRVLLTEEEYCQLIQIGYRASISTSAIHDIYTY